MADINGNMIFAVDFDGTLSQGVPFPQIGEPNTPLFNYLKREKEKGARLILYTCRTGEDLRAAVCFCKINGLSFDTVNENLPEMIEKYGGDTRKINADYYIDEKCLSFPTVRRFDYMPDPEEDDVKAITAEIYDYNKARQAAFDEYAQGAGIEAGRPSGVYKDKPTIANPYYGA